MARGTLLEEQGRSLPRISAVHLGVSRPRFVSAALVSEAILVVGLMAAAALLRWPDFLYVPDVPDKAYAVSRSAQLAQCTLHTLLDSSPYIGSLQNYLTAGLLKLFGPQVYLPRLLMLAFGCLTVGAAYLVAREWAGRLA